MILELAAALLASGAARGAEVDAVRRIDIMRRVRVTGDVVTDGIFRVRAPSDGRVESISAHVGAWNDGRAPLAKIASKEFAAMIDSRGAQTEEGVEERWKGTFDFSPAQCDGPCFVMTIFTTPKVWVKAGDELFEAAKRLKLAGRVGSQDAAQLRSGLAITVWRMDDPARKYKGKLANVAIIRDSTDSDFSVDCDAAKTWPPGTRWQGELIVAARRGVLVAPASAIMRAGSDAFLPMKVKLGEPTGDDVEILDGASEGRPILVLNPTHRSAMIVEETAPGAPSPEIAPPSRPVAHHEVKNDAAAPPAAAVESNSAQKTSAVDGYDGQDPYGR